MIQHLLEDSPCASRTTETKGFPEPPVQRTHNDVWSQTAIPQCCDRSTDIRYQITGRAVIHGSFGQGLQYIVGF